MWIRPTQMIPIPWTRSATERLRSKMIWELFSRRNFVLMRWIWRELEMMITMAIIRYTTHNILQEFFEGFWRFCRFWSFVRILKDFWRFCRFLEFWKVFEWFLKILSFSGFLNFRLPNFWRTLKNIMILEFLKFWNFEFLIFNSWFLVVLTTFQILPRFPQFLPFPSIDCRPHQRLADNNAMRNTDLMRNHFQHSFRNKR